MWPYLICLVWIKRKNVMPVILRTQLNVIYIFPPIYVKIQNAAFAFILRIIQWFFLYWCRLYNLEQKLQRSNGLLDPVYTLCTLELISRNPSDEGLESVDTSRRTLQRSCFESRKIGIELHHSVALVKPKSIHYWYFTPLFCDDCFEDWSTESLHTNLNTKMWFIE